MQNKKEENEVDISNVVKVTEDIDQCQIEYIPKLNNFDEKVRNTSKLHNNAESIHNSSKFETESKNSDASTVSDSKNNSAKIDCAILETLDNFPNESNQVFDSENNKYENSETEIEDWHKVRQELLQIIDRKDKESANRLRKRLSRYTFEERQSYVYVEHCMHGVVPLIFEACYRDNPFVIEYLIKECGTYVHEFITCVEYVDDEKIHTNMTALYVAAVCGKISLIEELVRFGADPLRKNNRGLTPIHGAIRNGKTDAVKCLVELVGHLDAYHSPTMLASIGNEDICEYLLSKGLDPNYADEQGDTALHLALQQKIGKYDKSTVYETVEILIGTDQEIDVNKENKDDHNALVIAANLKLSELVSFLSSGCGANRKSVIDSMELLAANLFDDKEIDYDEAMEMWKHAMYLRHPCQGDPILKPQVKPKAVFNGAVEPNSLEELARLPNKRETILFLSALIRERVLGESHHASYLRLCKFVYPFSFLDHADFNTCQAFNILRYVHTSIVSDRRTDFDTHSHFLAQQIVELMFPQFGAFGDDEDNCREDCICSGDAVDVLKSFIKEFEAYCEKIELWKNKIHSEKSREKKFEAEAKCRQGNDTRDEEGSRPINLVRHNPISSGLVLGNTPDSENHVQESKITHTASVDDTKITTEHSDANDIRIKGFKFVVHDLENANKDVYNSFCSFCDKEEMSNDSFDDEQCSLEKTYNISVINGYEKKLDHVETEKNFLFYLIVDVLFYIFKITEGKVLHMEFEQLLRNFIAKNPRGKYKETLLHAAVVNRMDIDYSERCRIIYNITFQMLYSFVTTVCSLGVPINSSDKFKNTPLHTVFNESPHDRSFLRTRRFPDIWDTVQIFVDAGSHVDYCNKLHISPIAIMKALDMEFPEVNSVRNCTLQCLASSAIMKYKIPYKNLVTPFLESFIELHDCHIKKKRKGLRKMYRQLDRYLEN